MQLAYIEFEIRLSIPFPLKINLTHYTNDCYTIHNNLYTLHNNYYAKNTVKLYMILNQTQDHGSFNSVL